MTNYSELLQRDGKLPERTLATVRLYVARMEALQTTGAEDMLFFAGLFCDQPDPRAAALDFIENISGANGPEAMEAFRDAMGLPAQNRDASRAYAEAATRRYWAMPTSELLADLMAD